MKTPHALMALCLVSLLAPAMAGDAGVVSGAGGTPAPDADEAAVRAMRAAPLSGDWRRIGGNLEMVAALHVNTAGFPIPRVQLAASAAGDEQVLSLVAAGALAVIDEEGGSGGNLTAAVDTEALGRAIARGMLAEQQDAREREARAAEWATLVATATTLPEDYSDDYDDAMGDLIDALAQE
jgi:hypothetical protein